MVGMVPVKQWAVGKEQDSDDAIAPRTPRGWAPSLYAQHAKTLSVQLTTNPMATASEYARLWSKA